MMHRALCNNLQHLHLQHLVLVHLEQAILHTRVAFRCLHMQFILGVFRALYINTPNYIIPRDTLIGIETHLEQLATV